MLSEAELGLFKLALGSRTDRALTQEAKECEAVGRNENPKVLDTVQNLLQPKALKGGLSSL